MNSLHAPDTSAAAARSSEKGSEGRATPSPRRLRVTARGQVQGVGFRPFVYRLAHELGLTGTVGNTSEGVRIEIQGSVAAVEAFPRLFLDRLPPLARLTGTEVEDVPPLADETDFTIVTSEGHRGHNVLISPDVGICPDCLSDMRDPLNRRYAYPFTNCTNCGPRYTITRSIPYDRATTSMACFPLCPDCAGEYADPLDRRFHAQPVACPVCGPRLWYVTGEDAAGGISTAPPPRDGLGKTSGDALTRCAEDLLEGKIVALRGLGGFQLACDARNEKAVAALRRRKSRPSKSFALMVADTDAAREFCAVSTRDRALLESPARPATVLWRTRSDLLPGVAPDIVTLAVMLPTTPLHVALFDLLEKACGKRGRPAPVLVMTSGNASGDPICLGNREALRRLGTTADAFLLHDRDILVRVDDSVVLARDPGEESEPAAPFFLRRARGYVPSPVSLAGEHTACAFGCGADLKATCCVTRGSDAFVGQHIGDLEHVTAGVFYEEVAEHLTRLLEVRPDVVVGDLHPDFLSREYGLRLAEKLGVPFFGLQHHAAHAFSVLAEHGVKEPCLALVLDGFGLGDDGTLWGGEVLGVDPCAPSWKRLGRLARFGLPGGDAAVREPWRIALALALEACPNAGGRTRERWTAEVGRDAALVAALCERGLRVPPTSSCGRLFDAVAAELGLCSAITYEGQAAILLETAAWRSLLARSGGLSPDTLGGDTLLELVREGIPRGTEAPPVPEAPVLEGSDMPELDVRTLFSRVSELARDGADTGACSLFFHLRLCGGLVDLARRVRDELPSRAGKTRVALAGGVFNNTLLRRLLVPALDRAGFEALLPLTLPPGDGGLSLGQAAYGLALLEGKKTAAETDTASAPL